AGRRGGGGGQPGRYRPRGRGHPRASAKAYTAVAFSSHDLALDSKTIGLLARPDGPGSTAVADIGTDAGVAPLFGIGNTNPFRPLTGVGAVDDRTGSRHHGIVTFAGGQPVYHCHGGLPGAGGGRGGRSGYDGRRAE